MDTNVAVELLEQHHYFESAQPLVDVEGLSSARVCNFLNRLVARLDPGECYLEVGTWKGRTLISAALGNAGRLCVGCDRFKWWGRFTGPGVLARRALHRNVDRHRAGSAEIRFFDMPFERLFAGPHVPTPVGVYFYDGDHSHGGTTAGVIRASPWLGERAVILLDDWSEYVMRRATRDALRLARLRVLWHTELPGDHGPRGWWNGLDAFYVEKERGALRARRGYGSVPSSAAAVSRK
jgi:hypothetical protein